MAIVQFVGERLEAIGTPRNQDQLVPLGGQNPRECLTYSRRRACNQGATGRAVIHAGQVYDLQGREPLRVRAPGLALVPRAC